jgi:hypothetical protein
MFSPFLQWSARITGMLVCGVWLVILILWSTNSEDFTSTLNPLMLAIIITMGCILIAWRWELVGGIATIVGAVAVLIAAWYALSASGSAVDWYLLAVPSLPFLAPACYSS